MEKADQFAEDRALTWNAQLNAADVAYILYRAPVLVAVHAREMLRVADPTAAGMPALSDAFPVLLGPVRVEYRFTATELLVRVFPDEWAVDSFEEQLTAREQDHALLYWRRYWEAGGEQAEQLAAWRDLASQYRTTGCLGWSFSACPKDEHGNETRCCS